MTARRLDGAALAARIRGELVPRVQAFTASQGRPPGLGILLVGRRPESELYVRNKLKAAADAGCRAELVRIDEASSLAHVLDALDGLNRDAGIDGILVQSPLPAGMGADGERRVFDTVHPDKDVDGFHPLNVGRLVQKRPRLVPCTPLGCIELLEREQIPLAGRRAVVIGRSDIVGKPMALLLLHRDATVTLCHSRTEGLPQVAAQADVLVAALGRPGFVTAEFVKPGATVIDVGINVISDATEARKLFASGSAKLDAFERKGSVLVGDVHPEVERVAGAVTPVPGGVGPMTIAMVLRNTITAAEHRQGMATDG